MCPTSDLFKIIILWQSCRLGRLLSAVIQEHLESERGRLLHEDASIRRHLSLADHAGFYGGFFACHGYGLQCLRQECWQVSFELTIRGAGRRDFADTLDDVLTRLLLHQFEQLLDQSQLGLIFSST